MAKAQLCVISSRSDLGTIRCALAAGPQGVAFRDVEMQRRSINAVVKLSRA